MKPKPEKLYVIGKVRKKRLELSGPWSDPYRKWYNNNIISVASGASGAQWSQWSPVEPHQMNSWYNIRL